MLSCAVSGLDQKVIRFTDRLRISDDRLVGIPHIPAAYEFSGFSLIIQKEFYGSGSEQMADIRESDGQALIDQRQFIVFTGVKEFHRAGHIVRGI